jgi:hypothetical protein
MLRSSKLVDGGAVLLAAVVASEGPAPATPVVANGQRRWP